MRHWDIFCKVVDNFGDIGTCWRLARQLTDEYQIAVRLWVDDLHSFARFNTSVSPGVATQHVDSVEVRFWSSDVPDVEPADVVIEAFACEIPASYVAAMAARSVAPVWINLEYLSAEAWVEECHLLTSPHPGFPLTKHFFFPGFSSKTGGLLRERDLLSNRAAFDHAAANEFWQSLGIGPTSENELRVSLFCYENPALPNLLNAWAGDPGVVRVMTTPGSATEQVARWMGSEPIVGESQRRNSLIVQPLPFLTQSRFDQLLWACDVNFVRGEDSFVRAQWAQKPFVWQIYPQADNVHLVKLDAFMMQFLAKFENPAVIRSFWHAWNGVGDVANAWREFAANRESITQLGKEWARQLDRTSDLANNQVSLVRKT